MFIVNHRRMVAQCELLSATVRFNGASTVCAYSYADSDNEDSNCLRSQNTVEQADQTITICISISCCRNEFYRTKQSICYWRLLRSRCCCHGDVSFWAQILLILTFLNILYAPGILCVGQLLVYVRSTLHTPLETFRVETHATIINGQDYVGGIKNKHVFATVRSRAQRLHITHTNELKFYKISIIRSSVWSESRFECIPLNRSINGGIK